MTLKTKTTGLRIRRRIAHHRRLPIVATIVVALFLLASAVPGLLVQQSPEASDLGQRLLPPTWFAGLADGGHPLGTDALGRDMLARIVHGARYSFIVAFAAVALAGVIGVVAGVASAFAPRPVGIVVMRLADAALGIPLFLVALTLAVAIGPGISNVVVVVGALLWAQYARVVSTEVAKVRQLSYIDASRILGTPTWRMVLRHVLPNIASTVLTLLASQIGFIILLEASLSFLGAGVPPPAPAWGSLVADGRDFVATAWWISAFPGAAILVVVIALNSQADWLRDRLDPKGRTRTTDELGGQAVPVVAIPMTQSTDSVSASDDSLLVVENLTVERVGEGQEPLVDGVSLHVRPGEFVGLIGESGSGKSVTASALVRLLPDSLRIAASRLSLDGIDLLSLSPGQLQLVRGGRIGFVFQDHTASLDPTSTVGAHLTEVLRVHGNLSRRLARAKAIDLLARVGIPDAAARMSAYPHQLSGGMGQRVAIAAALAGNPDLIIADEPTTALDATVQRKIIQLLRDICTETGLAMLLITHDLGVARQACDRIMVMYSGRIVETGPTSSILERPESPYTRALLSAIPDLDAPRDSPLGTIFGVPLAAGTGGSGCKFADRCPLVRDTCRAQEPELTPRADSDHLARCWATEPDGWDNHD